MKIEISKAEAIFYIEEVCVLIGIALTEGKSFKNIPDLINKLEEVLI